MEKEGSAGVKGKLAMSAEGQRKERRRPSCIGEGWKG